MKLQRAEAIDYAIAVTANVKTLTTHTPKVTDGSSQNGLVCFISIHELISHKNFVVHTYEGP